MSNENKILTKAEIIEKMIKCGRILEEQSVKDYTCPECGHYPLELWGVEVPKTLEWITWRECRECKWNDRPRREVAP